MIFHSTTLLLATVQWFGFAGSTCVFPRPSLGHNRFPDERIWTGMGALGQLISCYTVLDIFYPLVNIQKTMENHHY